MKKLITLSLLVLSTGCMAQSHYQVDCWSGARKVYSSEVADYDLYKNRVTVKTLGGNRVTINNAVCVIK